MIDARHVSFAIVRIVSRNKLIDPSLLCKIASKREGSRLGPLAGPACCARSCPMLGQAGLLGQISCHRSFSFSKAFSNLVSKQTCKFNINLCSWPKIMKLILLGF